jgi:hypothetical protein
MYKKGRRLSAFFMGQQLPCIPEPGFGQINANLAADHYCLNVAFQRFSLN